MGHGPISRRRAFSLAAGLAVAPGLAMALTTPDPVPSSERLRFLDEARRLTVQTYVNGAGPFPFMVDTGANSSVISRELADDLGLERRGQTVLHHVAGSAVVDRVGVASLKAGDREQRDLAVSVVPEATLGARGLLGLDWLGRSSLTLDYARGRMVVGAALEPPGSLTFIAPARTKRNGLTLIDAYMPGGALLTFIDSGSTTTIGNLALLEAARKGKAIVGETVNLNLRSVTGEMLPCTVAVLSSLRIGGLLIRWIPVVMGPIHTFDFWGLGGEPAILVGTDVLQKFKSVALDVRRGEVRFSISDRPSTPAI
ncbi:retropepsin-like aspartic protease [Caulobacter segnis]|jgi:predicted aspartyl protease|uniref:retropepsin-like aspartic protease n=1 Tax=Caulobacter segnis TaxID=88688 RepID=UPI001CBFDCE5|nr:retropepsin-like aspartic protease [Caulobacter segnis]UAL09117.1 retroviral-like aspartic protease family protein [Caulobacter segnis]